MQERERRGAIMSGVARSHERCARLRQRAGALVLAVVWRAVACAAIFPLVRTAVAQQPVVLRIQPHVGDTLRMKLDQRVEMTDEADSGRGRPPARPVSASMRIYTRSVVLRTTASAETELLSITDSVIITPAAAASLPLFAETKRALQGRRPVHLWVAPDGAISVAGRAEVHDASGPPSAGGAPALLVQVPAVLPPGPVKRGDSWVRDLRLPVSAARGGTGLIRVTFHLDSLGPDDAIAYISMYGTLSHDSNPDTSSVRGQLTGTMQVDRRLKWLTDSRMTVAVDMTSPPQARGTERTHGPPGKGHTRVHVKVTQWLRAIPAP